jgi:inorganic pyrophosphatase
MKRDGAAKREIDAERPSRPRVDQSGAGRDAPILLRMSEPENTLVCVVEIPKGSRNKYEYDEQLGGIKFDRLLMSAATYPADYGFLRGTLGQDGDPLDALVCLYEPTFPGCLIPVKPVGMFKMSDEKGIDDKIICVPLHDPYWNGNEVLEDLPLLLRQEIEQFFSIYKDLEGKLVTIEGWRSVEEAEAEIEAARARLRGALP